MTSFTRKLYLASPAAAEDFHRTQTFEHRAEHGRVSTPTIEPAWHAHVRVFGKRAAKPAGVACRSNCGHGACSRGCVLLTTARRTV